MPVAAAVTGRNSFDAINQEVGARLAERRRELSRSLREVANDAEMSTSHLSDIESGACRVSLPVLLRIVRALDLTITELLPQIGGHRVFRGSIEDVPVDGVSMLSHADLDLGISMVRLDAGERHEFENPQREDVLVYVLAGAVACEADGTVVLLDEGDALDTEQVAQHRLESVSEAQVLVGRSRADR